MNALLALSVVSTVSAGQLWVSSGQPPQVVELFTSEGCSSCPPADKYISTFENGDRLWKEIVPIVYHVDYWNYLGWSDRFAKPEFSQLQRLYHAYDVVSSVYTPGFVVDNKEWRGFFNWVNRKLPDNQQPESKQLTLIRKENTFELRYEEQRALDATIVFITNNQTTTVRAGENRGKKLEHDFIATQRNQMRSNNGQWTFTYEGNLRDIDAVVAWVTPLGSFERVQTVAGKIE